MLSLRLLLLGMAAIALGACATSPTPTSAPTPTPTPSGAQVTVDGESIDVAEGDVIRRMPRRADGSCEEPGAYSVRLGGAIAWVDIYFDPATCELIVRDIGLSGEQGNDPWPTPTPTPLRTTIPAQTPQPDRFTYCPDEWESYFARLKPTVSSFNAIENLLFGQFFKVEANPALLLDEEWQRDTLQRIAAYERAAIREADVTFAPDTLNPVDSITGEILRIQLDSIERMAAWVENLGPDDVLAAEAHPKEGRAIRLLTPYFNDVLTVGAELHRLYLRVLPPGCIDAMIAAYPVPPTQ